MLIYRSLSFLFPNYLGNCLSFDDKRDANDVVFLSKERKNARLYQSQDTKCAEDDAQKAEADNAHEGPMHYQIIVKPKYGSSPYYSFNRVQAD